MMMIVPLDKKVKCTHCSGYGVFNSSHKLAPCQDCGSIHAEALGLTYPGDHLRGSIGNAKFLYVREHTGFSKFLVDLAESLTV